ncbi:MULTISPECIES: formyltransferase family protein [Nocardia]|uniref:formyltransferase family protein n=1 Tax=Nocardia TaxID=1817 RepID=UPI00189383D7|nr:hypothetical protein [Nocardia beijingensis]
MHRAVLDAGDPVSGASVHFVSGDCDTGQVMGQVEVPVRPGDTPPLPYTPSTGLLCWAGREFGCSGKAGR